MLILPIPEDFHKLFEDGRLTSVTPLCKPRRVVIVAVHPPFMLVVAILGTECCRANRASKVIDVVLVIQRSNV